jgi:transposase InsO family protein
MPPRPPPASSPITKPAKSSKPFSYVNAVGWLYLALVIDLCSRKIIGWHLADHMRTQHVTDALQQALRTRATTGETMFHSERGSNTAAMPALRFSNTSMPTTTSTANTRRSAIRPRPNSKLKSTLLTKPKPVQKIRCISVKQFPLPDDSGFT